MTAPIYVTTNSVGGFPFLHTLQHLLFIVIFFNKCILFIIILLIYFWLRCVFVAGRGFSLVMSCGGYSLLLWLLLLWNIVSRCTGFSSCGLQALEGLSICGARAYLLHSEQDLPGPVTALLLPALQSRLLATEPPGKPYL